MTYIVTNIHKCKLVLSFYSKLAEQLIFDVIGSALMTDSLENAISNGEFRAVIIS